MSEDFLTGFAPLADDDARVLILGSMPSAASLTLGRYYGHPRNRFWPVMAALFPASADDLLSPDFDRRYAALKKNGVALWDTIGRCRREGSLDSAIRDWTPNDIGGFLKTHPDIGLIILNGKKSEAVWRKSCGNVLFKNRKQLRILTLLSTSPANAAASLETLTTLWREALAESFPTDTFRNI